MQRFLVVYFAIILTLFLSFNTPSFSSIKGVIVNKETRAPLSFASVSIKNKSEGVIANENGLFEFHVKKELNIDTLIVSMLGYERYFVPILSINNNSIFDTIGLVPTITHLKEIEVSALTVQDIIQNIKASYRNNYNTQPFIVSGFFRNVGQENGVCTRLIEASVNGYDKGFSLKENNWKMPVYSITQIRSSKYTGRLAQLNNNENNGLVELNSSIHLEILKMFNYKNYVFYLEEAIFEGEIKYFILSFHEKNEFTETKGRFIVNVNNWSIKEVESSVSVFDKNKIKPRKEDSLFQRFIEKSFIIQFQEYHGKMYVSHIKKIFRSNIFTNNHFVDFDFLVTNEYLVNSIQTDSITMLKTNLMNMNRGLYLQSNSYSYNSNFWKKLNMISDNQELSIYRTDLEKNGKLEDQFKILKEKK
jgi:hypothetical protein